MYSYHYYYFPLSFIFCVVQVSGCDGQRLNLDSFSVDVSLNFVHPDLHNSHNLHTSCDKIQLYGRCDLHACFVRGFARYLQFPRIKAFVIDDTTVLQAIPPYFYLRHCKLTGCIHMQVRRCVVHVCTIGNYMYVPSQHCL